MMSARSILQAYLDTMSAAALSGDLQTYLDHVSLPFRLQTEATEMVVTTAADLEIGFKSFHETLIAQRVTDFIRLVEKARQTDALQISGRYTTHILAGSHRILPPFESEISLRLEGNHWRATSITNAMTNTRWPIHLPRLAEDASPKGADE